MPQPLQIRTLSLAEMPLVLGWAEQEGWNPGLSDAKPFWLTDPKGFIGGFIGDRLVACVSAVRYGDQFGFIGFYIVDASYRRQGYGIQMWESALDHLQGVSSIGLDGVVAQQDNYRKSGFLVAHRNIRFEGRLPFTESGPILGPEERLVPILEVPTDVILNFDALHFPISRPTFLEGWLHQPEHHGLAIMRGHEICAYGNVRQCATGYKIGPLFADNPDQARNLVLGLCQDLKDEASVYLDPPAANTAAVDLATELGMTMVFETDRMYKGIIPKLPIQRIFGITTFELG